jgi:hypothetical protein
MRTPCNFHHVIFTSIIPLKDYLFLGTISECSFKKRLVLYVHHMQQNNLITTNQDTVLLSGPLLTAVYNTPYRSGQETARLMG